MGVYRFVSEGEGGKQHRQNIHSIRAARLRDRSSSPGTVKNLHFSISSWSALVHTQLTIQWAPEASSLEVKTDVAWIWQLTTNYSRGQENVDLYAFIVKKKLNSLAWVCKRTIPTSDRRLSAKLVPTFADWGCHAVRVSGPYGRTLGSLDPRLHGVVHS
jgi:hypothetical protein